MKKFKITSTAGSLSGSGSRNLSMTSFVMVEDHEGEKEAKIKFNSSMENQMYGRKILSIAEELE